MTIFTYRSAPVDLSNVNVSVDAVFDCASTATVGDVVTASATVDNFVDVLTSNNYPGLAIGIIVEKLAATKCRVRTVGRVTGFTGLTRGKAVFVGTSGEPTTTVPTTNSLQILGVATSATEILLNVVFGKVTRI